MRRALAGMAAIIGLVGIVATACGDDGGDGGSSAAVEEFCAGFEDINERFEDVDLTDPEALRDALDELRQLDPPEEVADDYRTVLEGFEALSAINITDQEAVAEVEEQLPEAEEAFNAVGRFVDEEC
jgi:hypothetical protein